ncbi:unnamed protein product [Adineta steineri]|uniref:Uncharacterized protein n=1 Tax=Adineta steineri TaxID=433720 RepID=A0A820GNU6_9BILA|nr:unnamed protein product [Adineta steineri]
MNNNNRTGVVDDSETVISNAGQPNIICKCLKRRKVMWFTFTIIALATIITIPIAIAKTKKTNYGKTSTTTEKMEVTTGD